MDKRPKYDLLRQDEDWSALRDPTLRTDRLDRFKYVPLNADGSVFLSLAVDAYVSFRSFDNPNLGLGAGFDDTYNTRLNVHTSVAFGDRARFYAAVKHGDKRDLRGPVSPRDRDRLDLHQAFAEISFGDAFGGNPGDAMIRIGRQELNYGDGRLIAARLGPNVRADYDGMLLRTRLGRVTTDFLGFRGVIDRTGVFDNGRDRSITIWGAYSSIAGPGINLDVFYLAQDRGLSPYAFVADPLSETRHTLGARIWAPGANDGWRFGLGVNYQFGKAHGATGTDYTISAWSAAANLERSIKRAPLAPAAGIEVGVTSGDANPTDRRVGTFRSIAPPARLTGIADSFGPGNLIGIRPYIELHPAAGLRLRGKATAFWRLRKSDGLYSIAPGVISRPTPGSRFAGVEPGLEVEWSIDRHWTLTGFANHFFVGDGIGETSLRKDVSYLEATLSFKL